MTSRNPAAALAGILAVSLVSADIQISVQYDATYSLAESHGIPCSGHGAEPVGIVCPKAGDIATANCQPYLLSYNGAACVAPMDAQCVHLRDDTWGCAFLKAGYASSAGASGAGVTTYDE
ncbi:Cyst germination specific acidic repeat protein precursor, partial [Phytophthora palmivora]